VQLDVLQNVDRFSTRKTARGVHRAYSHTKQNLSFADIATRRHASVHEKTERRDTTIQPNLTVPICVRNVAQGGRVMDLVISDCLR
jgi:hypothetical protein